MLPTGSSPTPSRVRLRARAGLVARIFGAAATCLFTRETAFAANEPSGPEPVELDHVAVVGSRIRDGGIEGVSPVRVYRRDFIAATGALRLADFLELLPENYTGAGSGRGSAPNDANPEFGVRTESSLPLFNVAFGSADVPLGQSGVSGANLRGLGSGSTLVLVDGRRRPIAGQGNTSTDSGQGFVDLNTIPLGMIERVEVLADGASALYGSDAIGGVINVVLKKNYAGVDFSADYGGTFAGGARERRATVNAGFTSDDGRLRGMFAAAVYDRARLTAAQRDFSANQDHRAIAIGRGADGAPVSGSDLRLSWGYPAVVQAGAGTLAGATTPEGAATPFALVPEGARVAPPASGFVGVAAPGAAGLRQANTAEFLTLVAPQESRALSGSLEYEATPTLRLSLGFSHSEVAGEFDAQPPVSTPSATSGFGSFATVVPASIDGRPNALNPFGQDVLVGLVHEEFGSIRQTTRTRSQGGFAGASGVVGGRWNWDGSVSWQRERFAQRDIALDGAKFAAALASPDPAQWFNPFVDARAAGPVNAALYPALTAVSRYDGRSELTIGSLVVDGPLASLPGGELRFAAGVEYEQARHRAATLSADGAAADASARRNSRAVFAELAVPLVGRDNARPGLARAELQLAGRHQDHGAAGRSTDPKIGLLWAPVPSIRLRAGYSTGFRAPSLTEYETPVRTVTASVTDPRRTPAAASGVVVQRGSTPGLRPETSRQESYGVTVAPRALRGFAFGIDYHRTRQRNLLQEWSAQAVVDHEALFPGRVQRAPPAPEDLALGRPGAIEGVDATLLNFGTSLQESVDVSLGYETRSGPLGRFRLDVSGTRLIALRTELRPGVAADLAGDTAAPQRWRALAMLAWSRGPWSGSLLATYAGGFSSNQSGNLIAPQGSPPVTVVNLNLGRTFDRGLWRGWAKGAKVGLGIGNLFDRAPPFSDTVFGYNGGLHSPLGRTYRLSLELRF